MGECHNVKTADVVRERKYCHRMISSTIYMIDFSWGSIWPSLNELCEGCFANFRMARGEGVDRGTRSMLLKITANWRGLVEEGFVAFWAEVRNSGMLKVSNIPVAENVDLFQRRWKMCWYCVTDFRSTFFKRNRMWEQGGGGDVSKSTRLARNVWYSELCSDSCY